MTEYIYNTNKNRLLIAGINMMYQDKVTFIYQLKLKYSSREQEFE
jgi:hypothetical protein